MNLLICHLREVILVHALFSIRCVQSLFSHKALASLGLLCFFATEVWSVCFWFLADERSWMLEIFTTSIDIFFVLIFILKAFRYWWLFSPVRLAIVLFTDMICCIAKYLPSWRIAGRFYVSVWCPLKVHLVLIWFDFKFIKNFYRKS